MFHIIPRPASPNSTATVCERGGTGGEGEGEEEGEREREGEGERGRDRGKEGIGWAGEA